MAASPSRTFQFHCKDFLLRRFQFAALAEHLRVAAAEPALSLSNGSVAICTRALRAAKLNPMGAATSGRGIAQTRDRALTIRNQARSPTRRGTRPAQDFLARRFAGKDRRKFFSDPGSAPEGAPLHENESLPENRVPEPVASVF